MGNHLRVFANLGFWKPCLFAHDINVAEANWLSANQATVDFFLNGILKGAVSIELTSLGAYTPSTLANTQVLSSSSSSSSASTPSKP